MKKLDFKLSKSEKFMSNTFTRHYTDNINPEFADPRKL